MARRGGFPYRRSRCHICGSLAFDTDRDNRPICLKHPDMLEMFYRELRSIMDLIGKERKDAWLDEQWPGGGDVTINPRDGFERARRFHIELRREISDLARDSCECRGDLYKHREPCKACIAIFRWRYPDRKDLIKQLDR